MPCQLAVSITRIFRDHERRSLQRKRGKKECERRRHNACKFLGRPRCACIFIRSSPWKLQLGRPWRCLTRRVNEEKTDEEAGSAAFAFSQSVLENWWLHERWDEKRDVISHASGIHFNFASCTRETRRPIPRRFFSSGLSGDRPTRITWNASRLSSRLVLCPAACAEKGGICRLSNQPVANCSTRKSTVFVYRGNFI